MSDVEKQLRKRLEEVESELWQVKSEREKMLGVIEHIATVRFFGLDEFKAMAVKCREIMAEIKAESIDLTTPP